MQVSFGDYTGLFCFEGMPGDAEITQQCTFVQRG